MNGVMRAPAMLAGAAIAGLLLWVAGAHLDRTTNGGYWAALGIIAAAGSCSGSRSCAAVAATRRSCSSQSSCRCSIVGGWVLLAKQPHNGFGHAHVLIWSRDIAIRDAVLDIGAWTA